MTTAMFAGGHISVQYARTRATSNLEPQMRSIEHLVAAAQAPASREASPPILNEQSMRAIAPAIDAVYAGNAGNSAATRNLQETTLNAVAALAQLSNEFVPVVFDAAPLNLAYSQLHASHLASRFRQANAYHSSVGMLSANTDDLENVGAVLEAARISASEAANWNHQMREFLTQGPKERTNRDEAASTPPPAGAHGGNAALMAEFSAELRKQGLRLEESPQADGRYHSVAVVGNKPGKQSGVYMLRFSEDGGAQGRIINYLKRHNEPWSVKGLAALPTQGPVLAERTLTPAQRNAAARREEERAHADTAERVKKELALMPYASDDHPYLKAKGVSAHGLKLDRNNNLVMALRQASGGEVMSLQRISGYGRKRFPMDSARDGTYHAVGRDSPSLPLLIGTGYATSAQVFELTGLPVKAALSDGNLLSVARELKEQYPERPIFIIADNDHLKVGQNVGLEKAKAAAAAVAGHVIAPKFVPGEEGSDWNDLAQLKGRHVAREQLAAAFSAHGVDLLPVRLDGQREYLKVPYEEREKASYLGATWDTKQKAWYVPPWVDAERFGQWRQPQVAHPKDVPSKPAASLREPAAKEPDLSGPAEAFVTSTTSEARTKAVQRFPQLAAAFKIQEKGAETAATMRSEEAGMTFVDRLNMHIASALAEGNSVVYQSNASSQATGRRSGKSR